MNGKLRGRFWVEAGLASAAGIACLLTAILPDWLELAFGWDPDHHNGSVEWMIVGAFLVICATMFTVARVEWRRAAAARAYTIGG